MSSPSSLPRGLFNCCQRCWFNAALQAWITAARALDETPGLNLQLPVTPYGAALSEALIGESPNRADRFFDEFARRFFEGNPSEAGGQHDPVAAFCAIGAHTDLTPLRIQFLGLTERKIKCSRCAVSSVTRYAEPVYSCDDLSVLASGPSLAQHVLNGCGTPALRQSTPCAQPIDGVDLAGCSCPRGTPQSLVESRRLPRVMILAINIWEPSPEKAGIPRIFYTPTHAHVLIAGISKSGPPSGGHCWAIVADTAQLNINAAGSANPTTWWQVNDSSVNKTGGPDDYTVAGIYYRVPLA